MKNEKYKDAIDFLDSQFAYFVTHVLNIGTPLWDNTIPTAAVQIKLEQGQKIKRSDADKFEFVFNADFENSLNVEEYSFVLAHETLHILLNHLKLAMKFEDQMRFNIAADCVINDYLISCGLVPPKEVLVGEANVGYNCSNATVSQVYHDLPDEVCEGGGVGIQIDDHTWIHVPDAFVKAGDIQDILDAFGAGLPTDLEDIKDDTDAKSGISKMYGKLAGKGEGALSAFVEDTKVSLKWAKLLEKIDPDYLRDWRGEPVRPSFHKKPRKLGAYQDLYLPVQKKVNKSDFGERQTVFMALDTSGSIGDATANYFVNLARSVVKTRIKLHVITFTTSAKVLDLENPSFRSGGTSFGCIEKYILEKVVPENKNKYPKSVIVVTDAYADFYSFRKPEPKHQDRWMWLISDGGGRTSGTSFGTLEFLNNYT